SKGNLLESIMKRIGATWVVIVALILVTTPLVLAMRIRGGQPGPGGVVNLSYQQQDNQGNNWMVYDGGWLRQKGQFQIFNQGAQLNVNGNGASSNNQGKIDEKTGELILENVQAGNVSVTRRILLPKDDPFVRYIDIFKNNQAQEVTVNVMVQTNT